ncbi:MAG TPA: 23S rRNA (pseudouridine(1915)-N(3))-methyltransferase RlmH [Clostridia bacterium]|nr:23S rRNA (pseudouridine(1915)-N(3))-methyltransferase RlmH [Clostridia bacterium]
MISIGKVKDKFFRGTIKDYAKRLSRYTKIKYIHLKPGHTTKEMSEKDIALVKEKEGEDIINRLSSRDYVMALDLNGTTYDSESFAEKIRKLRVQGKSNITFIIGGSHGLSKAVLKKANTSISFSKMTFPHQLMQVILIEQVYRAFKIINNEPYHK